MKADLIEELKGGETLVKKLHTIALILFLGITLTFPHIGEAQSLYEKAKKEGKVVIYGTGDESFRRIAKVFNARYPDVQVEGQDMRGRDAREKIIAEQGAGQVVADLVSGGENSIAELREMGFLVKYQSPELKFAVQQVLDPLGFRNPTHINVYGIMVNKNILAPKDEPKKWQDLLDAKYKGKIAAQDPRGSGGGLYIMTAMYRVYGIEFVKNLAKQDVFFGRSSSQLLTGLIRGEHGMIMAASWGSSSVQKAIKRNAPIKFIKPSDGVQVIPISLALVKNAPHPNAARLWIDWILSEEGQRTVAKEDDTPSRVGIPAKISEGDLTGVKTLPTEDWTTKPELVDEMTARWKEIFFTK